MSDETKSLRINDNFHAALEAIKAERGTPIRFSVHIAIREHIEKYYPEFMHLVTETVTPAPPVENG